MRAPVPGAIVRIRKGLNLPIAGAPEQAVHDAGPVRTVALIGDDYRGLKPELAVAEGDAVKLGQTLFTDAHNPGVRYTAPGAGRIEAIHRGARRALQSVIIRLEGDAEETFDAWEGAALEGASEQAVRENLTRSGLWTAFRTRPFGRVPRVDSAPAAIFVTAMDTNPLAADPEVVIGEDRAAFEDGLAVLKRLTPGRVYVATAPGSRVSPGSDERLRVVRFAGPHPAGLPGTHIHFLEPVDAGRTVWYLGCQDVSAIGRLFVTGRLARTRVIALAGPRVARPRLVRAPLGASVEDLTHGELKDGPVRIVAGPVLSGRSAGGRVGYLGRYHQQVSVIGEAADREFLGWLAPGRTKFSAHRIFTSSLLRRPAFDMTTSQHGSPRAMVPIGSFERVMPLDVLVTPLLKALLVRDVETAQTLGCLELEEEDLALCSFVCCSKYDYGEALRGCLDLLEESV